MCPILPLEGQTSIFLKKLICCLKLADARVRSDSDQLQKEIVLMAAKPNFLVLLPLVPFMGHHSEKKIVEKHSQKIFYFTFSPFLCPMLPNSTVPSSITVLTTGTYFIQNTFFS